MAASPPPITDEFAAWIEENGWDGHHRSFEIDKDGFLRDTTNGSAWNTFLRGRSSTGLASIGLSDSGMGKSGDPERSGLQPGDLTQESLPVVSKPLKEASRLIEADAVVLGEILESVARIISDVVAVSGVGFRLVVCPW